MNILVTGGAGFIGSHTCEALLAKGHDVICVDNFNDYYDPAIKRRNIEEISKHPQASSFRLVEADICDADAMQKLFSEEKIDKIVHLAARAGVRPSLEQPLLYAKVNIMGTMVLLEQAVKHDVNQFIFGSSSSVYGANRSVPYKESENVDKALSPYAASKKSAEVMCYTYHHIYGINVTCLRFFTVYGPRGRPDMAPYIFTRSILAGEKLKVFGDGSSKRDYTFVADIVGGIIASLENEFGYEILNLGNNRTVDLSTFISTLEDITGKKALIDRFPMQPGDMKVTNADISKARKLIGYDPSTKFEQGLKIFVDWFRS